MCINVTVNLPNVETFLLLYSLRCGCIFILVWTGVRAFLCYLFFYVAILEVFTTYVLPIGPVLLPQELTISSDIAVTVYTSFIALIIAQAFLLFHSYYLAIGLFYDSSRLFIPYLVCRFLTWMVEIICLFVLCMSHKIFIGWYLAMLMFVVLETYCFIVVYSYYVNLLDYEREDNGKNFSPCDSYE